MALSTSIGTGTVAGHAGEVATCKVRGECAPMTKGPVDIEAAVLDTGVTGAGQLP